MGLPNILALDFDGVLCDGMLEYFQASRRSYGRVWPDEPAPGRDLFPAFRALRPVIMTGWEMPLLLCAIAQGPSAAAAVELGESACSAAPGGTSVGRGADQHPDARPRPGPARVERR
jgi:hypothetical protein